MFDLACHLCEHVNAVGAMSCSACGVGLAASCASCGAVRAGLSPVCDVCGAVEPLAEAARAAPAPRRRVLPPALDGSEWGGLPVLSLDDAVTAEETGASALRLRNLDLPEVWVLPDGEPLPPMPEAGGAPGPALVRTDSFLKPPGALPAGPDRESVDLPLPIPEPVAPAAPVFVDKRDAKAARRAAVRRARLAAADGTPHQALPTDVLVVDTDDATRQQLCLLLDGFGFNVQSSRSVAHAAALLTSRTYLAVFADVDLQDARPDGGVEVCRRAREGGELPDGRRSALILMSSRPSPADRVRAALAGSEQFLVKPMSRGDVARALEACDIALPNDPRGAAAPKG